MNEAEKEDIYQFGVILLEVITGKRLTSTSEIEELKDEVPHLKFSSSKSDNFTQKVPQIIIFC